MLYACLSVHARGVLHPDRAPGAAAVVDDHLLAHQLRPLLPDQPPEQVGAAAGRERDHETDRLGGIGLRVRATHPEGKGEREKGKGQQPADFR
ncbi:hypothetical protein D3C83_37070 [compost metagenome]